MAEPFLYPEGREHLSVVLSKHVKDTLRRFAAEQRLSMSQAANLILDDYLRRRGYLREREPERVATGG